MASTYVVDDRDSAIEYLCLVQHQTVLGSYYNNTWTTIASKDCGAGWFRYTFNGTRIRLVASSSHVNTNFSVQIDNSPLLVQTGQGIYESPILSDGQHTITYAVGDESIFPTFDYLAVTPGSSTLLANRTFIVDDSDASIEYSGNWSTSLPKSVSFDSFAAPYLNTTHWATSVDATLSFSFTGSSVSVFGVLPNFTDSASLTATYTVDGKSTAVSFPDSNGMVSPMTKFFHADLDSGDHTLLINVSASQPIGFDFITYNSSSQASGTIPPTSSSAMKKGVIVGAVLGAVFGLLFLLALIVFMLRKKNQAERLRRQKQIVSFHKEPEKLYTPSVGDLV